MVKQVLSCKPIEMHVCLLSCQYVYLCNRFTKTCLDKSVIWIVSYAITVKYRWHMILYHAVTLLVIVKLVEIENNYYVNILLFCTMATCYYYAIKKIQTCIYFSVFLFISSYKNLVMRKPAFCSWENKDPDQLRGNLEADQRLWFCYIREAIDKFVELLYY